MIREIEEWTRNNEFELLCRYFALEDCLLVLLSPKNDSSKLAKHKIENQSFAR